MRFVQKASILLFIAGFFGCGRDNAALHAESVGLVCTVSAVVDKIESGSDDPLVYEVTVSNRALVEARALVFAASCGCMELGELPKVILPGEAKSIQIQVDPKGRTGTITERLFVTGRIGDREQSVLSELVGHIGVPISVTTNLIRPTIRAARPSQIDMGSYEFEVFAAVVSSDSSQLTALTLEVEGSDVLSLSAVWGEQVEYKRGVFTRVIEITGQVSSEFPGWNGEAVNVLASAEGSTSRLPVRIAPRIVFDEAPERAVLSGH